MIVAVTGANGHVGVNLCEQLTARGHQVRALIHKHSEFLDKIPVVPVKGDLSDKESLREFLDGAEVVYHLAAKISITGDKDGSVWKTNAEGTRNMVDTARERGVRKFIHFSSIHAFQQHPAGSVLDEFRPIVQGSEGFAYDRSKAEGERIVRAAAADGFDAVVVNPTAILGPLDPQPSLSGKAVLQIAQRKVPALVPGGYDWVDVRDVVEGAIAASERGVRGEKYLLSGRYSPLPEFSAMISRITGEKTPHMVMPFWVARLGLPFITAYSRITGSEPLYTSESLVIIGEGSTRISNDKARRELGFSPRPLETTLSDLIDWFRENGFLNQTKNK